MKCVGVILIFAIGTCIAVNKTAVQPPAKSPGWYHFREAGKQALAFTTNAAKKGYGKLKQFFGDLEQQEETHRNQELERLASVFDHEPKSEVTEAEEMFGREIFDQIVANAILDEENN